MSSQVALCIQQLETQGCTVVPEVLSPRMIELLARSSGSLPEYKVIRQVFEGLPMRIMESLAGSMVLSMARYGAPQQWHRGRSDIVESGAPADFLPGFDVAMFLISTSVVLEVIPGSARLGPQDSVPLQTQVSVNLGPHDVAILDSRTIRRWPNQTADHMFWFSVVRPWVMPLMDFTAILPKDTPPRALHFAGQAPARDVSEWLFQAHSRRSK